MDKIELQDINKAWWQAARVAVRATVKNPMERDNALALLDKALHVANGVFLNASHDRNPGRAKTGAGTRSERANVRHK